MAGCGGGSLACSLRRDPGRRLVPRRESSCQGVRRTQEVVPRGSEDDQGPSYTSLVYILVYILVFLCPFSSSLLLPAPRVAVIFISSVQT